jgi:hypothetical protein
MVGPFYPLNTIASDGIARYTRTVYVVIHKKKAGPLLTLPFDYNLL